MNDEPNPSRSDAIIRVLKGLLRPLVRALIAQGVTAPVFYRLVKQAYVDVAESELDDGVNPVTDSRISVATGVHRRDVKAMRTQDQTEEAATRAKISTLSLVVGKWLATDDYLDQEGNPAPLRRLDQEHRIHFFSSNVGDHLAAAAENLMSEDPPFLERAVFYNRLTPSSVDEIEELARNLGNNTLRTINKEANDRQSKDLGDEKTIERFRFGMFFYREPD